ncbi:MAG TPA: prepilin-type N-terminal cleavage/methylation domain-containing protein [Candidatus Sulfotelmatobacter sp.]|jgi:general secretion pathway protein G|nr:prepilin-type N-terminal cleavage/methylation domain-containing protein [Candidatus Sulfotelmatobacter sp.]
MKIINKSRTGRSSWANGFTLIELMIVISIIFILIGMAVGRYDRAVQRSREAALHTDLQTMRQAIENFTLDKQAAPQSLDDLVNAKYLREVPTDPITRSKDWELKFDDVVLSPEQSGTGITDVHSTSATVSPFEGTPYNTW